MCLRKLLLIKIAKAIVQKSVISTIPTCSHWFKTHLASDVWFFSFVATRLVFLKCNRSLYPTMPESSYLSKFSNGDFHSGQPKTVIFYGWTIWTKYENFNIAVVEWVWYTISYCPLQRPLQYCITSVTEHYPEWFDVKRFSEKRTKEKRTNSFTVGVIETRGDDL